MELDDAEVERVMELASEGATQHAICEAIGCKPMTFTKWLVRSGHLAEYAQAKETGALTRLDELRGIVTKKPLDQVEATWQRTVASILQWELSKALPRIYGDRINHEHSGTVSVAVITGIDVASLPAATPTSRLSYSLDDADAVDSASDSRASHAIAPDAGLAMLD